MNKMFFVSCLHTCTNFSNLDVIIKNVLGIYSPIKKNNKYKTLFENISIAPIEKIQFTYAYKISVN